MLSSLCVDRDNAALAGSAGCLPLLLRLLDPAAHQRRASLVRAVCGALRGLAVVDSNKPMLVAGNAVGLVLRLCDPDTFAGTPDVLEHALWILAILAVNQQISATITQVCYTITGLILPQLLSCAV